MRDTFLTARTVIGLVVQDHWPAWRSGLWLIARWMLAIGLIGLTFLWMGVSTDAVMGRHAAPSVGMAVVLAGFSGLALVAMGLMVRATCRHRGMPVLDGLRLALTDPNAMLDHTLQPGLEMTVDYRGKPQWYGLVFLMTMLAGWPAPVVIWTLSVLIALGTSVFDKVFGTPEQRQRRRDGAQTRKAEQRALRLAHGSAFARWQREVLDRHPDAARELEGKILRQAMPRKPATAPRTRSRL